MNDTPLQFYRMFLKFLLAIVMSTTTMASHQNIYRLSTDVVPLNYWITLTPTFEDDDFLTTGKAGILVKCKSPTRTIEFNSNGINIVESSVKIHSETRGKSKEIIVNKQSSNNETQKYFLHLASELEAGQDYYLSVDFSYKLNENLEGFYRSSYNDSNGKTRWMATTQFSPINARRAFPCWDEPSFKAHFSISLAHHKSMFSLSNMPKSTTNPMYDKADWVIDHYETSLPMSTYLVAFIVTDLPHKNVPNTVQPQFKVWSRPELIDEMKYMGEISPKVLSFIAEYFNTPFPLTKIDLFAVPDFGFSAMENWGLITFAESAIKASKTIAHELAHQWFGNLATPYWWDDLWLKEGFATFIGVTALDRVNGNFNEMAKWIVTELQHSLFEDSLLATHPVSNPVDDPRKIWQAFDTISYEKGSSVIRMMCNFMGEDQFRAGLNVYLKKFAYKNAKREDLWQCYSNITSVDVSTVMDKWTTQSGYPVINVTRNYTNSNITVTQERFLLNGDSGSEEFWHVPFSYTYKGDTQIGRNNVSWLVTKENVYQIENMKQSDWLFINLNQSGYYRVNYDLDNWDLLANDFANLPSLSQVQLINDAFNLAIPGRLPYSIPFRLVEKLSDVQDSFIWNVTITELNNIAYMLSGTPLLSHYKNYTLSFFHSDELTLDSENLVLVKFASQLGQKNLVDESIQALSDMMQGKPLNYSSEVLVNVYCSGIENSGQEAWDFLWTKYLNEKSPEEKRRLILGLCCSRNGNNLKRLLDALMHDNSGVRKQEAKLVFGGVAANENGSDLALNFLTKSWKEIEKRYGLGYKIMASMVSSLGPVLNTQAQYNKFEKLYEENKEDLGSTSNSFSNALERIRINIKWLNDNYKTIESIIQK